MPDVTLSAYRLDRKDGSIVIPLDGREYRLRPTMEATDEIETALNRGIDVERTRLTAACFPYADKVLQEPGVMPTTHELALIFAAGARAGGTPVSQREAKGLIFKAGRAKVVGALWELVSAMTDGGRLREEDLKNVVSPNGSQPEPNGADAETAEAAEKLTAELEAGLHSDAGSG